MLIPHPPNLNPFPYRYVTLWPCPPSGMNRMKEMQEIYEIITQLSIIFTKTL